MKGDDHDDEADDRRDAQWGTAGQLAKEIPLVGAGVVGVAAWRWVLSAWYVLGDRRVDDAAAVGAP